MRVVVQCKADEDPDIGNAPAVVVVRPCALEVDDLQQLRRILHALVTSANRTVIVELSDVDVVRRTNVIAILVGAARDARSTGSTLVVHNPPNDGRRALFVAGIDEIAQVEGPTYEIVVGTATDCEPLAV
ncbi:MAG: STAS domain-containing protein [Actinomycetes bacterium]